MGRNELRDAASLELEQLTQLASVAEMLPPLPFQEAVCPTVKYADMPPMSSGMRPLRPCVAKRQEAHEHHYFSNYLLYASMYS